MIAPDCSIICCAAVMHRERRYGNEDGSVPATYQVIHMLGWKPCPTQVFSAPTPAALSFASPFTHTRGLGWCCVGNLLSWLIFVIWVSLTHAQEVAEAQIVYMCFSPPPRLPPTHTTTTSPFSRCISRSVCFWVCRRWNLHAVDRQMCPSKKWE